jgi:hypothetical protein
VIALARLVREAVDEAIDKGASLRRLQIGDRRRPKFLFDLAEVISVVVLSARGLRGKIVTRQIVLDEPGDAVLACSFGVLTCTPFGFRSPPSAARLSLYKAAAMPDAPLSLQLKPEHFPFWAKDRLKAIRGIAVFARTNSNVVVNVLNDDGNHIVDDHGDPINFEINLGEGGLRAGSVPEPLPQLSKSFKWSFNTNAIDDLWLAVRWGGRP